MNKTKESIYVKILAGYLIVLMVIACMAAILLHERQRMQSMERDLTTIRNTQYNIHTAHRYITELAFEGETVLGWDRKDYEKYQAKRFCMDSLLQVLRTSALDIVQPERIDTLRQLLADKEKHLHRIMEILQKQALADSILIYQLPSVAKQAASVREVVRKKKGIAGFFGKKEIIRIPPQTDKLYALNNRLTTMQKEREHALSVQTDSLAWRNKELNRQFIGLIVTLDAQAQGGLADKEFQLSEMRRSSFRLIAYVLAFAMLLLLIFYFIIHLDIRQIIRGRKKMEKIIEENKMLLEMRKNIILAVSHDIRGPLGNINNSAELAMDTREKKKRNAYLENICISCRHILHLVNNLLDIYRMNEKKESRNDVPFRPDRLMMRIAEGYLRKSNDKGLLFTTGFSGLETVVMGDADRIEQILDNLLANAVKFTEAGEIRFVAGYENGRLTMEVHDTGIGMSEETQSRIFTPFERAAQATNSEGFGLGLSITKGLVSLLDGEISVMSSVGKGSVFRVTLPLAKTDEKERENNRLFTSTMHLPRRVLVVDDDSLQLEVIREMLERNGVFCGACHNAREMVEALREQDYDLVLTDVQMPGTDGFGLLKLLRSSNIRNSRTVPVMVMTARGDKKTSHFTEAGFLDCIYKPFSTQELLSFISAVVRQENEESDVASFKALTSGISNKHKMLELFIRETERSIAELQDASQMTDRKRIRETVHRMSPLWEVLQEDKVLQEYRQILHNEEAGGEVIMQETEKIVARARELIVEARIEIAELKNETKSIDS